MQIAINMPVWQPLSDEICDTPVISPTDIPADASGGQHRPYLLQLRFYIRLNISDISIVLQIQEVTR